MLGQALFNYLHDRKAIDDVTFAGLLDAAARTGEELSRKLAAWNQLTVEQLAQVIRHDASAPGARRLATQRLRIHALEAG